MSHPTRTQAIKRFLEASTHADLAAMYHHDMEVQVNVAQDGGERISKEYKGRQFQAYTDGTQTWKALRIPYKANSEPEYTDVGMSFDLSAHVEGIGMTGWNWVARRSKWLAYDFDAIIGHSEKHLAKLTNEEMEAVRTAAMNIPWVTVRKSTSGSGLHLYVQVDVSTENHNEHAALARSILGKMSALTGFDFRSKVDICGGNMWVWHRKMTGTDGLMLLKQGTVLEDVPPNWRDHVKVVQGKIRKNLPKNIHQIGHADTFEELTGQRPKLKLDEQHKRLIDYLEENNCLWWWDQDHHMLVTHTFHLQEAHAALGLKGFFKTDSRGDNTNEQNCFCFPNRRGSWTVRRYTPGVQEHESWSQDGGGWTRCYLNQEPDLTTACRAFDGIEDPAGGFEFTDAEAAIKSAELLGVNVSLDDRLRGRRAKLKQHKDGRLVVQVKHEKEDRGDLMRGWLVKKDIWVKLFNVRTTPTAEDSEIVNHDDLIRKLVVETSMREDAGWVVKTDEVWTREPKDNIKLVLESMGHPPKDVKQVMGSCILKPWRLVNKPFQPVYPGDREWNRNSAQLRYLPTEDLEDLNYPTWLKLLNHCGSGLDDAVKVNPWCKANGLLTGSDYLKLWIASLFQYPYESLPYLFFYGPEDSGKSSFHQALKLLLTKGYTRADGALQNQQNFNGSLDGALLCVVEETDLHKNRLANRRIKDWVTSQEFECTYKGKDTFLARSTMHWIQCDNEFRACPIFPGDTRITTIYVKNIDPLDMIPRKKLEPLLEKEAPHFLAEVMNLEIPESNSRLNIPIVATHEKQAIQRLNQTPLDAFIEEMCVAVDGQTISLGDFYNRFYKWLDASEQENWSKIKVSRALPPQFPRGRRHSDGQHLIGNIWWSGEVKIPGSEKRLVLNGKYLEPLA